MPIEHATFIFVITQACPENPCFRVGQQLRRRPTQKRVFFGET